MFNYTILRNAVISRRLLAVRGNNTNRLHWIYPLLFFLCFYSYFPLVCAMCALYACEISCSILSVNSNWKKNVVNLMAFIGSKTKKIFQFTFSIRANECVPYINITTPFYRSNWKIAIFCDDWWRTTTIRILKRYYFCMSK